MKKGYIWNSISLKIVFVYFILIFVATSILGVFIIDKMHDYYMESIRKNITRTVKQLDIVETLGEFEDLKERRELIQEIVSSWGKNLREEMFVVNRDLLIVATNNLDKETVSISKQALDEDLIIEGLLGKEDYVDGYSQKGRPVKNMVFPIRNGKQVTGIVYIRADLSGTYAAIDQSKRFFIKAMGMVILITVIVGFLIAAGITNPIKKVTGRAMEMAEGKFGKKLKIEGDDEIGEMVRALNFMDDRMGTLLSELSAEKIKLEAILKNLLDGVVVSDLKGKLIHINQVARKILGAEDNIEEIQYDDLMRHFSEGLTLSNIEKKSRIVGGKEVVEHSGNIYDLRYDRYRDEKGEEGIILLIQDITERQKLEQTQMDFVANVSHELKTPLTTIKSYSETLLDTVDEKNGIEAQFLGIIKDETDRMSRMVRELLVLSKLDNNLVNWNLSSENVVDILFKAAEKMKIVADKKNIQMNLIYDKDIHLTSLVDKDKLEQVFMNLISNAIKYTDEGRRIDIDAYREDKQAVLVVSDNGIGIPEESISRVFERFYCVDKARTRSQGGTGLGLPISKQIIEQMEGTIHIESRIGEGTKAVVKLNLASGRGVPNID